MTEKALEKIQALVKELRWRSPDLEGFEDWWARSLRTEGINAGFSQYAYLGDQAGWERSIRILLALAESRLYQLENKKKFDKSSYYR